MELTNEQRMYLGLEPVEPAWERVEIPNNSVNPERSTGRIFCSLTVIFSAKSSGFMTAEDFLKIPGVLRPRTTAR